MAGERTILEQPTTSAMRRYQMIADAMQAPRGPTGGPLGGAAQMGQQFVQALITRAMMAKDDQRQKDVSAKMAEILGPQQVLTPGAGGAGPRPDAKITAVSPSVEKVAGAFMGSGLPELQSKGLEMQMTRFKLQQEADQELAKNGLVRGPDGVITAMPGYAAARGAIEGSISGGRKSAELGAENAAAPETAKSKGLYAGAEAAAKYPTEASLATLKADLDLRNNRSGFINSAPGGVVIDASKFGGGGGAAAPSPMFQPPAGPRSPMFGPVQPPAQPAPSAAPGGSDAVVFRNPNPAPGAQEGAYRKGVGELQAKAVEDWKTSSDAAAQQRQSLTQMRGALQNGLQTGTLAPVWDSFARFAQSVGVSPEIANSFMNTTDVKQFQSAAKEMVLGLAKTLGPNPSNADREFIEQTLPRITDPAQAAEAVLAHLDARAGEAMGRYALGYEMTQKGGMDPLEFDRLWKERDSKTLNGQPFVKLGKDWYQLGS